MREVTIQPTEFAELSAEVLTRGGLLCFRAHGSSMFPFIRDGDTLTVQPVDAATLNVGDIAFYHSSEKRMIAHRVVGRRMHGEQVVLIMRGDATSGSDEQIQPKQVLGRVIRVERGKKIIYQDQGVRRFIALLWVIFSPGSLLFRLTGTAKRVAAWLLRGLQALKLYRVSARKLIGKNACYHIATKKDASQLSKFYRYTRHSEREDPIESVMKQLESLEGRGYTLIARIGKRIAGATVITQFPENENVYPDWWIFGMRVRGRYCGAGIGEGLLRMAIETASEEGAPRVHLLVFAQNRAAIKLYHKMGFRQTSLPELERHLEEEVRQGGRRRIIMSRRVCFASRRLKAELQTTELKTDDLLRYCLRSRTDETKTTRLEQISSADWERIIQQSVRHHVAPLLYRHLQALGSTITIPGSTIQRLRAMYLTSAARNMRLYHELSHVLTIFRNHDIPVIVLKGAHLAEVVYQDIALRPMSDVDLLVKKHDLARSQQKLLEAGYPPDNKRILIDIHWNLENSLLKTPIPMENVWERAQPTVIAGVNVLALSPEDLLLHLCLHLGFHHVFHFSGLMPFYDIRETINAHATHMNWERVQNTACEWGIHHLVFLTLLLARELTGAQVPDQVLEAFEPEKYDPQIRNWALDQIFREIDDPLPLSPYFWQLWKPGSFRAKLDSLRKLILPPPEFVSQKYPTSFRSIHNYLYYTVRLKDHCMPYIRTIWRILRRDEDMTVLIEHHNQNIAMQEWLISD